MDNTMSISYLYQKRHQNTAEPLGGARQSVQAPESKAGVCACPLSPMRPRSFRDTTQRQRLQRKEVWYSPLISRTCNHLKRTFPFPGYSDPVDVPLHSSFARGLCWAKGGSSSRAEAGRQAGGEGSSGEARDGKGRGQHKARPCQATRGSPK